MEPLTINRFPIFAAWCYAIARRLGYSEDEAKSLAATRAKLGAAAKAGLLGTGKREPRRAPGDAAGAAPPEELDQLPFVGMRPYVIREGSELRGGLHQGAVLRPVSPREYETSVVRKLGEAYEPVLQLMEDLASRIPADELNARGYHLYERFAPMVRDESGRERSPRFGQRGVFDPAKVERLAGEVAERPK
jgi:hypothetical protein